MNIMFPNKALMDQRPIKEVIERISSAHAHFSHTFTGPYANSVDADQNLGSAYTIRRSQTSYTGSLKILNAGKQKYRQGENWGWG